MRTVLTDLYRTLSLFIVAIFVVALPLQAIAGDKDQRAFASPEEARQALVTAVLARNRTELAAIFGPALRDMESADPVENNTEFNRFVTRVQEGVNVVQQGNDKASLLIGAQKWPFPIPLVKRGKGWMFDTQAGREEIVTRRIGRDEITAINVCRSYVDAQREYYNMPEPDGAPIPKYAQHMISRPGKKDGLYWPTDPGEKDSPLGPLVAKAKQEGYKLPTKPGEEGTHPFHGYYFKIMKRQERSAPGGKFNYVINGNMVAGHALVAYPAQWGVTGVMTFIVNQSGRVYQKNLGPKTAKLAKKMTAYNPDQSWKLVVAP